MFAQLEKTLLHGVFAVLLLARVVRHWYCLMKLRSRQGPSSLPRRHPRLHRFGHDDAALVQDRSLLLRFGQTDGIAGGYEGLPGMCAACGEAVR